jgi:hypothetical protein
MRGRPEAASSSSSSQEVGVAKWIVPPIVVPFGLAVVIVVVFLYRHFIATQFLVN